MRRLLPLLLALLLLGGSLAALLATSGDPGESAPPGPKVVSGPLLTPPNPDVYPVAPFVLAPARAPISVTPAGPEEEVLAVLVEFSDVKASRTPAQVEEVLFDEGANARSVRSFYLENSYDQTRVIGTATPWYESQETMAYYGADGQGIDDANGPIYCLTVEAVLKAADAGDVNFAQYDTNGDGTVDHLFVVHAGGGQETSTDTNLIWSHRWVVVDATRCGHPSSTLVVDGVRIHGYIMVSETSPLGVWVHEFGHSFGLPDLYDTKGATLGIGVWGVMGTGSWNGNPRGTVPAHFTAWSKAKLGWLAFVEVTTPLLPAEIPALAMDPVAYRLSIKSSPQGDEYFIVENRQQVGFDAGLPGSGLLIWHADETRRNNDDRNRRLLDLEEADEGRGPLFRDNPTQASDAWRDDPEGFTPNSVPNSNANDGSRTGWKVTDIGPSAALLRANITKGVALDLAIYQLLRPSFVEVNETVTVGVPVTNQGLADVTNGTVVLEVYRGAYELGSRVFREERALPALAEGVTTTLSFAFVPDQAGRYILEATSILEGDEIAENNHRIVHLRAGQHLFREDVEGDVSGWTADDDAVSAYRWAVVADGDGYGLAYSPTRSWRFGFFGTGLVLTDTYVLTAPEVSLEGATPRLLFHHRYELATAPEETGDAVAESDEARVELSVDGGPWTPVATYTGIQLTWTRAYVDLAPWATGADRLRFRFVATASVQPNGGGWWVDDIVVATVPLAPAALLKPLDTQKEVLPGGSGSFLFLLVNVGDLAETFHFRVEALPSDWTAAIGQNETVSTPVETYEAPLEADSQLALNLVVSVPLLAERGRLHEGLLVALTPDESAGSSFIFSVQVPMGFGFALGSRALVVALLIGGVMLALAVVLTALRRRETY